MTAVEQIDKVIGSLFNKLNKTYHTEYTKLYKISRKYRDPNSKLKALISESKVFTKAKDLFLTTADKEIISIMESSLASISKKMGVSTGRIAYAADFKSINDIFINNIDQQAKDAIMQNMGINLYEDSKTAYSNVTKALGKSMAHSEFLLQETLVTTTRHITKLTYDKIEKDLSKYVVKYQYVGPSDSKTSDACNPLVGRTMTAKEWVAIKADIFTNGMHPRCRHSLDIQPIKKGDLK